MWRVPVLPPDAAGLTRGKGDGAWIGLKGVKVEGELKWQWTDGTLYDQFLGYQKWAFYSGVFFNYKVKYNGMLFRSFWFLSTLSALQVALRETRLTQMYSCS